MGAVYPLYLLIPAHREPAAKDLIGLIAVFVAYPWATAMFHLTPFDGGLVLAICLFGVPTYLSLILRGANLYSRTLKLTQIASYTLASLLSLMAITNPWHGQFAEFAPHVPGQANHALSHTAGIGMSLTYLFEFIVVGATLVITGTSYSRTRWKRVHILSAFIIPAAALGASLFIGAGILKVFHVNPFFVVTAAALWVLNYSFARKQTGSAIRISHSEVIAHMPDAIVIVDNDDQVVDYNPAFSALFDCTATNITHQPLSHFLPGQPWITDSTVTRETSTGEMHLDIKVKKLRGDASRQDRLLLVCDVTERTNAMRRLQSDQTQLNEVNTELLRISNTDPLTGLHNRRYFDERFEAALGSVTEVHTFALLMVDIDHFKRINDTFGHQTGDRVLVELAQQMQIQCREHDLLARIGGEEFAVILSNVDQHTLPSVAARFHKGIQVYVQDVGVITTSIGGLLVMPGDTSSSAIRRADEALYQAKGDGRNRVVVAPAQPNALGRALG